MEMTQDVAARAKIMQAKAWALIRSLGLREAWEAVGETEAAWK